MKGGKEQLQRLLKQEDTILFIGSGISRWSGLPSWPSMIEELAQYLESVGADSALVRSELSKGDLLQAASYGFDKLTKFQIGDFIRASCRFGSAKPHEIHRKLVLLGPRCFITTNYDDLIEQSLRIWQSDRFFRGPITNRHLTETAEIVNARAIDFIFKPHGDAGDTESIILTREQYRQLVPPGERQAALESLKMLMASRPVIYIGFGLRDPDFMYVRDLLANTYRGGIRDHYAIMADVSEPENDYWRRNYGIHLISYKTIKGGDGRTDHTNLLKFLDELVEDGSSPPIAGFDPQSPDTVLALARYAAGLARVPKLNPEFTIHVRANADARRADYVFTELDRFNYWPVQRFLDEGPQRSLLIGLPGAGKTYSLRRAAARLAEKLHDDCLADPFDVKQVIIPVFCDLKLYRGSLDHLINQTLPPDLSLLELLKHFRVKVFLDSFNEMPREYWENGSYETDFARFTSNIGDATLVIGSRTEDGLSRFGLPAYHLDQIDADAVSVELQKLGIEPTGIFEREVKSILQRPFFFRLVTSGTVLLPKDAQPRDFYEVWFRKLRHAFQDRFAISFNIVESLSLSAYDALNRGEEAFPLSQLLEVLNSDLGDLRSVIEARDIANWLVAQSILIPYIGGRVAFVHQSITEYLAATQLAARYQATPHVLREKLALTRWDQALFLTLSLLPADHAGRFLSDVIKADFALALSAVKYMEVARDEAVATLLSVVPEMVSPQSELEHRINWLVATDLPISESHEPLLRNLLKFDEIIGGAAAKRLIELKGSASKDEFLPMLVQRRNDFNFCTTVGAALRPFAVKEDAKTIAEWADSITADSPVIVNQGSDYVEDSWIGFTTGAAAFLGDLDLSIIWRTFIPSDTSTRLSDIRETIACHILRNRASTDALALAGELLIRGSERAAVSLYFIAQFRDAHKDLSWASFNEAHLDRLESMVEHSRDTWGLEALESLCAARPDLAERVSKRALEKMGLLKALLLHCALPTDNSPIFDALEQLIKLSDENRTDEPIELLEGLALDWSERENLFVRILRTQDSRLVSSLFGGSIPPSIMKLGILDIGDIGWWLEWILESTSNADSWFAEQLGSLFGEYVSSEKRAEFIGEFNNPRSKFRPILHYYVLPYFNDLTTDSFSDETISFLLAHLATDRPISFRGPLLARTATEQFVADRLLPLLSSAAPSFAKNLRAVIKQAGIRHGRRYLFE